MVWIAKQANGDDIPEMEMLDRRRADKLSDEPVWQTLQDIAQDREEQFKQVFIDASGRIKEDLVLARMSEGFNEGNLNKVQGQLNWEDYDFNLGPLKQEYTATINQAGRDVIVHLPPEYRGVTFNVNNPRVVEYIDQRTGELITGITNSNQRAVRNIIQDTYLRGVHPDVAARHIRDVVGLTERQSVAVNNFVKKQIEDGVPQRLAYQRGQEYSERLLEHRAETIARTETMDAVNHAQQEVVLQGVDEGIVPANSKKEYITTPDERLCEYCEPVDGQVRGLNEDFTTDLGNFDVPPIHPRCRCSFKIIVP